MTDVVAGRFALCDPIARGGSGTVWRAYDRKQRRFCAAKVLRRRDAGDLLRFVREQSVRLEHPHVLTPYSWAAEDAHVVIASELVDGGSLSALLGDYGALDAATTAAVLDQLLQALEHVHAAGLVHRDVKPANLLLRATGGGPLQVMLGDFGLAVGADDARLTEAGFVMGTPGYVAPELLTGGVAPEGRHDLYAAGRVAAALLAGTEGGGAPATLPPGPLADTVHALCATDPARRPATASAARARLGAVRADLPPRTEGGEPVEVLHQLPPLSDEALTEAGADGTQRLSTNTGPLPEQAAPTRRAAPPAQENPAVEHPVSEHSVSEHAVSEHAVSEHPVPGGRRRRPLLLAAAGLVVVAAVGVPLGLALSGDDTTPRPSTPASGSGSPAGSGAASGSVTGSAVRVGDACTFVDEGDTVTAQGGVDVTCTKRDDGSYVWERT